MTPFKLEIITPDGIFFPQDGESADVGNVIVRTTVGDKGILAKHEPYVAALPIGTMRVMVEDGKYKTAAISGGTVRVEENGDTVVLVQSCEWSSDIDVPRAEQAKHTAEENISKSGGSGVEFDIAQFKLKRALNRIDASKL
ncbi:MAG: ATP synthase F1 subunit epsilon [Oscillospiraceae bacterium]|nr:ATP synthase F1 subunit epsilon [Oscillospiraceae bacterium]